MRTRSPSVLVLVALCSLTACSHSASSKSSSKPPASTTTTKAPARTTTTRAPLPLAEAARRYQVAAEALSPIVAKGRADLAAHQNDFAAMKTAYLALSDGYSRFDAELRAIAFPDPVAKDVAQLEDADRQLVLWLGASGVAASPASMAEDEQKVATLGPIQTSYAQLVRRDLGLPPLAAVAP